MEAMSKEIVLEQEQDSYAGRFIYCDKSIHDSLEKYDMIKALMEILTKEMPWYEYTLKFKVENGSFINELNIEQHGPARENDTRDQFRDAIQEGIDRRDSEFSV